jgi:hypothetical protein
MQVSDQSERGSRFHGGAVLSQGRKTRLSSLRCGSLIEAYEPGRECRIFVRAGAPSLRRIAVPSERFWADAVARHRTWRRILPWPSTRSARGPADAPKVAEALVRSQRGRIVKALVRRDASFPRKSGY